MAESKIEKKNNVKIARVFNNYVTLKNDAEVSVTFNLPSDFHKSYGVVLVCAWPQSTWQGAGVVIARDNTLYTTTPTVGIALISNSNQNFEIVLNLLYE